MSLQSTPNASRLHIGIYGKRNAGKSSLINALTGQQTSLVSSVPGTTTDPVYKPVELRGFGPAVFIDTAGLDDEGELGAARVARTKEAAGKTDVAVFVFASAPDAETEWIDDFRGRGVPVLTVINKCDALTDADAVRAAVTEKYGLEPVCVSALSGEGTETLRQRILDLAPEGFWDVSITGGLAHAGDTVLLVMPQDIQAPRGRLILPQVQTIRELLDKRCVVISCTASELDGALAALAHPPKLIITDSQVFPLVHEKKPPESLFTSFSVLFAASKGDIDAFLRGAEAISSLREDSRVLIAEACAHAPTGEDIGREKIPALLRRRVGQGLQIDFVRGADFPDDLSPYDLVIHCGACMFNRRHVLTRIAQAERQGTAICNYGIVIAALTGILDKVSLP
ncbi:MAG: [Clostridia bacterium]|nr:[FeFe] hydrogenase H-cluster maturation GTPase HydF [Clostridia bacterium]